VPDVRIAGAEDAPTDPAAAIQDSKSDFVALIRLWRAYRLAREGPRRELRRWCQERRLSLLRLSEWEDVHAQVADRAASLGLVGQRKAASYTAIHRALLAGFCTLVGMRGEEGEYLGARGIRFHIFPGSALRRRRPRWVMAANIVETSRVFGRIVAEIEPMWIESAALHLSKREFLEPDFDEAREQVVARERVTFFGLVLSANRIVNYGPIAPEESRLIFAREALVYGRLLRRPEWLQINDAAIRAAEQLEERLRVRNLLQPPEFFVDFYAERLPRQVSSAVTLERFTRHRSEAERQALLLSPAQIFARAPDPDVLGRFPETARTGGVAVPVEYRFAPGEATDGATLKVPLLALPTLTRAEIDAAVPGLVEPRIIALLRSLPKEARRDLIPIAAAAQSFLAAAPATDLATLANWLKEARGIPAERVIFDLASVPAHLAPRLSVTDESKELCSGSDLAELRLRCAAEARRRLDERAHRLYAHPWRRFETDELPRMLSIDLPEGSVPVFPTLVRARGGAEVRFEWSAAEAASVWHSGAAHLAWLMLERQTRDLAKLVTANTRLSLGAAPYFNRDALVDLMLELAFRRACFEDREAPRVRAAFEASVDRGRGSESPARAAAANSS
jgi:ATP-dependent helicase HrpA